MVSFGGTEVIYYDATAPCDNTRCSGHGGKLESLARDIEALQHWVDSLRSQLEEREYSELAPRWPTSDLNPLARAFTPRRYTVVGAATIIQRTWRALAARRSSEDVYDIGAVPGPVAPHRVFAFEHNDPIQASRDSVLCAAVASLAAPGD